jgi:hypothetical protein
LILVFLKSTQQASPNHLGETTLAQPKPARTHREYVSWSNAGASSTLTRCRPETRLDLPIDYAAHRRRAALYLLMDEMDE